MFSKLETKMFFIYFAVSRETEKRNAQIFK